MGLQLDTDPILAGYPAAWFSPSYKMLSDVWRESKLMLAPVTKKVSEQEHRLELITGGVLDMWSLDDPDSARGRHYKRIVVDEAAMIRHLETAWTHVIRPTLADLEGDAYFFSTPKGLNYFYDLYQNADKDPDRWISWRFPTHSNPFIKMTEIEEMRQMLPERTFQQEILAEFVADGNYFQNIDQAATIEERDTPENHVGHSIYMAVDWGKSEDWSVFGVACRECNRVVDWERFNKIDYIYQRERLKTLRDRWQPRGILPERNSMGEPNVEMLVNDGWSILQGPDGKYGYYTSPTTKPPLIESLSLAFTHYRFQVPKEAAGELAVYEVNVMDSGYSKFGAPSNQHDDWVMMLALLWHAMENVTWLIT